MGVFDLLESRCEEIAGKVGMPPETVRAMGANLQAKIQQEGLGHLDAVEAIAKQHGLPVDKIHEMLSHVGGAQGLAGLGGQGGQDVVGSLLNIAGGLLKR